jgi:hypothetical protein
VTACAFDPADDEEDFLVPPPPLIECGMCRLRVPEQQTRMMSGRRVCLGCLASWYDEDDED